MDVIQKIPYILTAVMTMIIGGVSYASGLAPNAVYLRMLISMVAFLCIGFCVRMVVIQLKQEVEEKQEKVTLAEAEKQAEETPMGSTIDFRIDDAAELKGDAEEDFSPLTVSQIIRAKIKDE